MGQNNYSFNTFYHNFPSAQQPFLSPTPSQPRPLPQTQPQQHQHQQQRQPQPQAQPYQTQSYAPQYPPNYAQYYYNQNQQYHSQFQQYPQSFYPPQPQNIQSTGRSPQPGIQVVIPAHPYHSSPRETHQRQTQPPSTNYQAQPPSDYHIQPYPQFQAPSQPFTQPPPHSQPQPSVRRSSGNLRQSNVSVEIPSPGLPVASSRVKVEEPATAAEVVMEGVAQQRTLQQSQPRVLQAREMDKKAKRSAASDNEAAAAALQPDYPTLLCVLADDYLEAARKLTALSEEYYRLVATALGCLESNLTNFKLPPLQEAQISLRYAQILYEETENYDEAETKLTKSIDLCERHKFVDLKYEMHLLLSKVLYESRPKAAIREIERIIEDIEAYRHTVWLYVFRFQHALLSLASSSPGEVHGAVVQLEKIASLARQNGDSSVLAFAALLEALLHLSSPAHDAVTATQMALAQVRSLQTNPNVEKIPQMTVLMEFIDLSCSVRAADVAQMEKKRKQLHTVLYESIDSPNWRGDGFIRVPVSKRSLAGIQLQADGHIVERDGKYFLTFSWLGKEEVEALGFLFSADSCAFKNGADGGKAERFAQSGLSVLRSWGDTVPVAGYQQSQGTYLFRKLLEAQFLFILCFMQSAKGLWSAAADTLAQATKISEQLGDAFPVNMTYCLLYLKAAILQGTGNLPAALEIYQSPTFSLGSSRQSLGPDASKTTTTTTQRRPGSTYFAESDVRRNFCILAAMNAAFIVHHPRHPQHNQLNYLIKSLDAAVQNSGNKYIQAHYSLLVSVLSTTTLTVKQYLRSAMEAAKAIGSAQTTALALIYMQEKLFKGTVDEQGMKCARAASHQVKRWGEPMWAHVAAGLEADSLEVNGHAKEAQERRAEAESGWDSLPEKVRASATG
ncbi:hypothetical protein HRR83_002275 [Exophiala dermatitidis]|uniref:Cohesin loading factor n=2 Tax=Exophiala dermatitidis TaxID=5970 RepID=H6BY20_EXODN|nr:uncharacterized protein HMPREF1120_04717 [Exophiala dermatitidis NIH/UT8656]KAJ4520293.1 hypothetical protein HRR75_002158 [Exophiala dermatitidis]EHY56642.1 hypothetical protein HMPREF1120_04717 [Exophiala dermatitidis NIH/UT8656]KAJ4524155.1 hypothetical protein HRR74_002352 [Exophiala dermatitidis]KAJ4525573.1 hypothetical protein HRR73_002303 [Exophiala dermatitidis]KAJ4536891.1 hypothetical protein HRR76_004916 [Exophiala dermatitidis]